MTISRIFYTTAGALRAPWRLLLFVVSFIGAGFVAAAFVAPVVGGIFSLTGVTGQTVSSAVQLAAALIATWFALRHIEKREWSEVGLNREAASPRMFGGGFIIGSLAIALPITFLIVVGWLDRADGTTDEWAGPLLRITMLLLPAAFAEEVLTRGYLLSAFRDGLGWRWAVAITSVAFGLLHLRNPGANLQSVALVSLAGVFLAVVRISTGSLYAAASAHFAFNWVMVALFHSPVSGLAFEMPAYRYVDAGPDWATGGAWGPESGLPAGVAMLAATVFLLRRRSPPDSLSPRVEARPS